jgi:sulfur carrier protein ThiS
MILIYEGKRKRMHFSGKTIDLLRKLGISSQNVIIFRNGKIITEEDSISDKDKVEIKRVIFGG